MTPPTKNGDAPRPIESRKNWQSHNPDYFDFCNAWQIGSVHNRREHSKKDIVTSKASIARATVVTNDQKECEQYTFPWSWFVAQHTNTQNQRTLYYDMSSMWPTLETRQISPSFLVRCAWFRDMNCSKDNKRFSFSQVSQRLMKTRLSDETSFCNVL